jgi:hypothetical protein
MVTLLYGLSTDTPIYTSKKSSITAKKKILISISAITVFNLMPNIGRVPYQIYV